jgi:beta-glucosidase
LPPDAEGYDRLSLELSLEDKVAIDCLKNAGHAIVLIVQTGAPIALGDVRADAVLLMNYAGEGAYEALQSIIYGIHSPSGRLCATWTERRTDVASDPYFPSQDLQAQYRESIYVGYRYHTTFGKSVAFPFGYGLTYGEFRYEKIDAELMSGNVFLTVRVTNTGQRKAKEVVQAYVSFPDSSLLRPFCELKAWAKVELEPQESRDVVLKIPRDRLMTYTAQGEKKYESGVYYFLAGSNARDFPLIASVKLSDRRDGDRVIDVPEDLSVERLRERHLLFAGLEESKNIPDIYKTMDRPVTQEEFEQLLGRNVPKPITPQGVHAPLHAIRGPLRSLFLKIALKRADAMPGDRDMNRHAVLSMPLRALARLSDGILSPGLLKLIVFLSLRGPYRVKRIRKLEG